MALDVKVESPAAFATWLAAQARRGRAPADAALARGMQVVDDRRVRELPRRARHRGRRARRART